MRQEARSPKEQSDWKWKRKAWGSEVTENVNAKLKAWGSKLTENVSSKPKARGSEAAENGSAKHKAGGSKSTENASGKHKAWVSKVTVCLSVCLLVCKHIYTAVKKKPFRTNDKERFPTNIIMSNLYNLCTFKRFQSAFVLVTKKFYCKPLHYCPIYFSVQFLTLNKNVRDFFLKNWMFD